MPTLENNTLINVIEQQEQTITFKTKDTYVENDIIINNKVQPGTFNNRETTGVNYSTDMTENTVIPAGGALYLNEGWFKNTKIDLGHLIPDYNDKDNPGNEHILTGYAAYDENGKSIVGTMTKITDIPVSGGDIGIQSTPSITKPTVNITQIGEFNNSTFNSQYGVRTSQPENFSDGTNWAQFSNKINYNSGSVAHNVTSNSENVIFSANTTGYIDKTKNSVILNGKSKTEKISSTVSVEVTDSSNKFYIPLLDDNNIGIQQKTNKITPGIQSLTTPTVTVNTTASQTTGYGITTTLPSTGEGTYVSFGVSAELGAQGTVTPKVTGNIGKTTISIPAGAIKQVNNKVVSDDTTIDATGSTSYISATITGNQQTYYIPKINTPSVSGTITTTFRNPNINNPSICSVATSGTLTSQTNMNTYSILSTVPQSGDYLTLGIQGVTTTGNIVTGVTSKIEQVKINQSAGLCEGYSDKTITPTIKENTKSTNITIPELKSAVTNFYLLKTDHTAKINLTNKSASTITNTLNTTGLQTYTTGENDSNFIPISVSTDATACTIGIQGVSSVNNYGGLIQKGSKYEAKNETIIPTVNQAPTVYIKKYDGTYSIS